MNIEFDRQKETPMSSVSHIVQTLEEVLNERANSLAKETGFIQRVRTFTGADFAQTMIFGWLQEPDVTLDGLTQILRRRKVEISAPGLSQRFTLQSAQFMERILQEVTQRQLHAQAVDIGLLRHFSAVYVEDSSSIVLPEQLAQVWRGCGGSQGTSPSALKLFARWDVLNGQLDGPVLTDGRHSDRRSPLPVEDLPDGCLYIADLGFWGVARFSQIARRGQGRQKRRYFLSRLQPGVTLRRRNGAPIMLAGILPQQVGERLEFGAVLGKERLPVRVCIERVPREVGDQRRQEIRENAQDHGRVPSEEVLYLADWTIIISNVPTRLATFDQVLILLRLRWQIERLFRLWKEHGQIDESRSHNPWRILTEIYSKLSAMVIQQWLLHEGCWQDPHRSLFKAAQIVRREATLLMRALSKGDLEEVLTDIIGYMQSGCQLNTRKLRPNTSQFLMGEPHRWPVKKENTACSLLT
jgi:Transposase DDE domain